MKKVFALLFLVLLTVSVQAVEMVDVAEYPSCKYCGMDRAKFAHSRMLVEYDDGTRVPTCSLHCTAVDLANNLNRTPMSIKGGDYFSHEMIDAQTAVWVLGGTRPGVMSARGKWAFTTKEQAEKFVAESGGNVDTFENAIKAAYEDMYRDTLMIREKRKARMMNKP